MSSRKRLTEPPDSDRCEDSALAAAMQEVAAAEARAEAARARAARLSREAAGEPDVEDENGLNDVEPARRRVRLRRLALRRPGPRSIAAAAATLLICAALALSGYVTWYHHRSVDERARSAEFAAAARQRAITLMSIDAGKAREDLQRIIDDGTGQFKNEMLITANDRAEAVEQSKLSTKAAVTGVAVESMTKDSAVVLVTAKSELVNADNKTPPQYWRLVMTLQRVDGQLKVSKLEYVR